MTQCFWSYFLHKCLNGKLKQCNGLVKKTSDLTSLRKNGLSPPEMWIHGKTETNSVSLKVHVPFGLCGGATFSLSVGKTGSMNQTLQKPPQHTLAPTGKTLWLGNSNSASTNRVEFLHLSITLFQSCWRQGHKGVKKLSGVLALVSFFLNPGGGCREELPTLLLDWQQGRELTLLELLPQISKLWESNQAQETRKHLPPLDYSGAPSSDVFQTSNVSTHLPLPLWDPGEKLCLL